jgi:U32 family peptidase
MSKYIPKRISAEQSEISSELMKPELMSPAGDWECVKAAVENGADAVYFGLDRFNARMRANNFTLEDLPELMAFLHHRGVKGYLTFNTLVFTQELQDAVQFLKSIIAVGVDAAIVQDVGICRLIRKLSPDFPIHASTQMSISSEAGLLFAKELGASVTVLARECSLDEIASIKEKTQAREVDMPIEIFVHGALCVAYSGQCLTSESLGGRSANRGECAQACRLPYELYAEGERVHLGNRRYLLSPQDLSGIGLMPDIIRAGVKTLKIEGRLKTPEYVAAVTQVYRKALDQAWDSLLQDQDPPLVDDAEQYKLEMTFSRGLDTGWMEGIDNQRLVHARFGKKRGVKLGIVDEVTDTGVWIHPETEIKAGDGIVFDSGHPDKHEEGGRIKNLQVHGGAVHLKFLENAVDLDRIRCGQPVWKTSDPLLERELRKTFEVEQPAYHRPVEARVSGAIGEPLVLEIWDEENHRARVQSEQLLIEADKHPLDETVLRKQLGRLGQTPYSLGNLIIELKGNCMFPMSALNQLRRDAVDALDRARKEPLRWQLDNPYTLQLGDFSHARSRNEVYLIPYVRSWEQFEAVMGLPYREVYLELENPSDYKKAVERFKRFSDASNARTLWVAPPRMYKTGEDWIIEKLLESGADGYLARNHEHLRALSGQRMRGDFSLNVANPLTADWLTERWGLERLTASYDLNNLQLMELLKHSPTDRFEITLHQHMPMFHMEHCVFCAFLTRGKDFRDCGRPCDTRQITIKDRVDMYHPLKADAGCRNTVFNAKAQTGADYVQEFIDGGVNAFRIEFLNESADEVVKSMDRYERLLQSEISGNELWRELKLINQLGVTRGTMRNRD